MKKLSIILHLLCCGIFLHAQNGALIFKENKGQWPAQVNFMTEIPTGKIFLEQNAIKWEMLNATDLGNACLHHKDSAAHNEKVNGHIYSSIFLGSNLQTKISGHGIRKETYNYILGKNSENWKSGVRSYSEVIYEELYAGIDLKIYSAAQRSLKYDFEVSAGADASQIKIQINDADEIYQENGEIKIKTAAGIITEKKPVAWQVINGKKKFIQCNYRLNGNTFSFDFPEGYSAKHKLIIDPVVLAATFAGATMTTFGSCATYDEYDNMYIVGHCFGQGYPASSGAFQFNHNDSMDLAISKFDPTGSNQLFATYVGGVSADLSTSAVTFNGELIILGLTQSANFPVISGCFDASHNGMNDLFVLKLNQNGTNLIASTYVGGSSEDGMASLGLNAWLYRSELVCDKTGNVYVATATQSGNFPVTGGAYSTTLKGTQDAVVFRMDSSFSIMQWCTFLGGTNADAAIALRLDMQNGVYVAGNTKGSGFPSTAGCAHPAYLGGSSDGFITHFDSAGALIASTFVGANLREMLDKIDIDLNGNVYVLGTSGYSNTIPPSPGVFSSPNAGRTLLFRFDSALSTKHFQTRLGTHDKFLDPYAFMVDSCGNIYISGATDGPYPITPDAFKDSVSGTDFYFAVLAPNASALKYGSYYGGSGEDHSDHGTSAFTKKGVLYQSGCLTSGFPMLPNAYATFNVVSAPAPYLPPDIWFYDHAGIKIDFQQFLSANISFAGQQNGCSPFTANFVSNSYTENVQWDFGDNSALSNDTTVSHVYATGTYTATLVAVDSSTCNVVDTVLTTIVANDAPFYIPVADKMICGEDSVTLSVSGGSYSYLWSNGDTGTYTIVNTTGLYWVQITNGFCTVTDTAAVILDPSMSDILFPNIFTPNGDNVNDEYDFSMLNLQESDLKIFNRWGKPVFASTNTNAAWNGAGCTDGTYFFMLRYKTNCSIDWQEKSGFVTLQR